MAGKAFWPRGSTSLHAKLLLFRKENRKQTSSLRHLPPRVPAALSSGRAELPAKLAKAMAAPRLPATLLPANCVRKLIGVGGSGHDGEVSEGCGLRPGRLGPSVRPLAVRAAGTSDVGRGAVTALRPSGEGAVPLCRPHVFLQTPHGFSIGGSGRDGGVMSCPFSASTPMRVYPCIRVSVHPSIRSGAEVTQRAVTHRGGER